MTHYRTWILLTVSLSILTRACTTNRLSFETKNRVILNGIYMADSSNKICDLDAPVVTLNKSLGHHVAWYSIDKNPYTVDFNTSDGSPFSQSTFLVNSDGSQTDSGIVTTTKDKAYFRYRITSGTECKGANGTANDPYDPGVHITK